MTSIEFLKDWMSKNQYFIGNDLLEAFEQAKEMHNQETEAKKITLENFEKYLDKTVCVKISPSFVDMVSTWRYQFNLISDEEIEKAAKEFWGEEIGNGIWSMGAKWYREQLKKDGNV